MSIRHMTTFKPAPRHRAIVLLLITIAALAGCSQQGGSAQPSASAAQGQPAAEQSAAAADLTTYRELIKINNDAMASQMGESIERKYPGTDAAKEVQQTLPAIAKRYKENSEKDRLARLWLYQVSPMAGGTQSTAAIESSEPAGDSRVRLILRRHTAWGQNVFLYGSKPGFICRHTCTLPATFDGKKEGIKAFAPSTGEPALMIKDDTAFIAKLKKASKITLEVIPVATEKPETLVYEVGGFVTDQWKPLNKGAAGKRNAGKGK